jgi:hypothetical protein
MPLVEQLQKRLVDKRGGLQDVVTALSPHQPRGFTVKLGVHKRRQPVKGVGVSVAHGDQQQRHFPDRRWSPRRISTFHLQGSPPQRD